MKLAVTSPLPVAVQPRAPELTIVQPASGRLTAAELIACQPDALVCLLSDRVDDALLEALPRLQVVANVAVGLDNIDVAAATARGVCVTNTPDVLTDATAELTLALLLATARRLTEGEQLVRSGQWRGWALDLLLGVPIAGATLGIVGLGRIGGKVAQLGRALGMQLCYAAPRPVAGAAALGAVYLPLRELLRQADFVSLHCPLRAGTRTLLDRDALALMKPSAILLNTARGELVDEDALCEMLETGRLWAAGLDVFCNEPQVSPRILACPRITLAPHLGSATTKARTQMAELAIDAAVSVLRGQPPKTLVNQAAWPPRGQR
ncbi:MAG TPA: D-glycerate dehydrogenase [Kofleriaceae bacterium]|nr:D-glycerate dehydrogenase [Kofleriaceae bacterium]